MKRTVLILTKSQKRGGYCVAGIDCRTNEWVRLVNNNPSSHGALSDDELYCTNGKICEPMDVVDVELEAAVPVQSQKENCLIKHGAQLVYRKTVTFDKAIAFHRPDCPQYIYLNTEKFLTEKEIYSLNGQSLILIHADNLLFFRNDFYGKRKCKVTFQYSGKWYRDISLTDIEYCNNDVIHLTSAYLVVSLPDVPFADGCYYKFVAKVFVDRK